MKKQAKSLHDLSVNRQYFETICSEIRSIQSKCINPSVSYTTFLLCSKKIQRLRAEARRVASSLSGVNKIP